MNGMPRFGAPGGAPGGGGGGGGGGGIGGGIAGAMSSIGGVFKKNSKKK
jgi:hypothetical protein